jgi:hypothetical protein
VKTGNFTLDRGKNSLYLPQNELKSAFNGKISPYFTIVGYSNKIFKIRRAEGMLIYNFIPLYLSFCSFLPFLIV